MGMAVPTKEFVHDGLNQENQQKSWKLNVKLNFSNFKSQRNITHSDQKLSKGILHGLRDHSQLRGSLQALPDLPQHVEEDGGEEDASSKTQDNTWGSGG